MAIAKIQTFTLASSSGAVSLPTSAGTTLTSGNYLLAGAWGWTTASPTSISFSDTDGNTWTVPTGALKSIAGDLWVCGGFAKITATGSATPKITCNQTGGVQGSMMVVAAEFSGIASIAPLDGSLVGTTGTTGAPAPGSLALTSGDLAFAVMVNDGSGTNVTVTTPSGYTSLGTQHNGNTFEVGDCAYAINPSSPTNPTWNSSTVKWGAIVFGMLAAAGGGSTGGPFPFFLDNPLSGGMFHGGFRHSGGPRRRRRQTVNLLDKIG